MSKADSLKSAEFRRLVQIAEMEPASGIGWKEQMYFVVEPEVGGGLGNNSVVDSSVHPPRVSKLHYHFDGWLGDDVLESFPCYLVTRALAVEMEEEELGGFHLDQAEVSKSDQFEDLYPGLELPEFCWLKVTGKAGRDDFGISDDHRLVVSNRALAVLRRRKIEHADIEEF